MKYSNNTHISFFKLIPKVTLITGLTFSLISIASSQETEPNDTFDTANTIELNTDISAMIANELDWYRFEIPNAGQVIIHQEHNPFEGRAFQYWVFGSEDLDRAITGTETNLTSPTARSLWLEAGTYFIYFNGRENVPKTYTFQIEHIPSPPVEYDIELNDEPLAAPSVPLNETHNGHIRYTKQNNEHDELDWYRFVIPDDGHVFIHQEHDPFENTSFQYWVYGIDNLNLEITGTETNLTSPTSRDLWLQRGTYLLQFNGRGSSPKIYSFQVEHIPSPPVDVDFEPNDEPQAASDITLNATHTGHISFTGQDREFDNADWYRIQMPVDGEVTIQMNHEPGPFGFQYFLYREENPAASIFGTETGLPSITSRPVHLAAGSYLLQVSGRGERTGRTYTFSLQTQVPTSIFSWELY